MATGLQFKENLSIISGGYPNEGVGSNGVVQDWTETPGDSGTSTVEYYYHDSALTSDANSTIVYVSVTDTWTATKDPDNTYHVTVHSVLNYIRREVIGSPAALSASIFVRRYAGGPNIWTSGGCINAAAAGTHATNVDLGTYTIDLPPGQETTTHGAIYYRSNICGYDTTPPPSIYVDEYWVGINFRNVLPPDYRPWATWDGSQWLSHNRSAGWSGVWDGSTFKEERTVGGDGSTTGESPYIRSSSNWVNSRKVGQE